MYRWKKLAKRHKYDKKKRISDGQKPNLVWCSDPLLNFKYWSNSLVEIGYNSKTIMSHHYGSNDQGDFDLYFDELDLKSLVFNSDLFTYFFKEYLILEYLLTKFDIIHTTVNLIPIQNQKLKQLFYQIAHLFGCKVVVIPYGSDYKRYSRILDTTRRHTHLYHYPIAGNQEEEITNRLNYSIEHCDIFIPGSQTEGISRWDVLVFNPLCIDLKEWSPREKYVSNNHKIVITHSPNHKYIKGSSFLINAIKKLQIEGLKVELILLQGFKNSEVKKILGETSDIHVENLHNGYGLNAIEAMSLGIPVISNLSENPELKVFRRYGYLNECPALSSNPEDIYNDLKILILNQELRIELSSRGRAYVEKYHSYSTSQFLFSKVYDKIWFGNENKIMAIFDPNNPESCNNQSPIIEHPLVENKIPEELMKTLKIEP